MSVNRGSLRQRNIRNADVNENSDPYSSSGVDEVEVRTDNHNFNENHDRGRQFPVEVEEAATSEDLIDSTDGGRRRKHKLNPAMDLIANLPSRGLSSGSTSLERHHSSLSRARTRNSARRKILTRQSSYRSDVEQPGDDYSGTLTEEERWEKCQSIRDMAASIGIKRQRKAELMQAHTMRLTGYNALKFRKNVIWQRRKEKWNNFLKWFKIWVGAFKTIDGQFGMAVGSYFRFLKWLLFLNIYILMIIAGSVIIPQIVLQPGSFAESVAALNITPSSEDLIPDNSSNKAELLTNEQLDFLEEAIRCSASYIQHIDNLTSAESIPDRIANFLQGKGFPEKTFLFYGHYFNKTYFTSSGDMEAVYIMPLAYILATAGYFIVSLLLMVLNSARGFKESFVDRESRYFQYSCKIFTAWDFCMTSEKVSKQKHDNLYREFKLDVEHERIRAQRENRSRLVKFRLFIVRVLINIVVLITLAAAGAAIYYVNEKSLEWSNSFTDEYLLLAIQYAPSASITLLNAVIPLIFIYIVQPEDYLPEFEIKITLIRTVFLRLSSLAVLIASLYGQIAVCSELDYKCGNCGDIKCWEVYVGQQFYRLAIMDLVVNIAVVLCFEFSRRLVVERFKENKFFQLIGLPEFDIPRSVLDLVYGQTLCWIGTFFCPILPLFAVVKLLITFYLKKASLLRNFISSARTYRASKSNSFFTIVLLVSFVLTTLPVGYSIGKIPPSKSCGPFRIYSSENHYMFSTIGNLIWSGPQVIGDIFRWLGSVSFIAPLIIILCIAMYYYYIVASGHRKMIETLKDQLAMEGRDKRFLIDRINESLTAKYGTSAK